MADGWDSWGSSNDNTTAWDTDDVVLTFAGSAQGSKHSNESKTQPQNKDSKKDQNNFRQNEKNTSYDTSNNKNRTPPNDMRKDKKYPQSFSNQDRKSANLNDGFRGNNGSRGKFNPSNNTHHQTQNRQDFRKNNNRSNSGDRGAQSYHRKPQKLYTIKYTNTNQFNKERYDNKKSPDRNQSKKDRYDNKKSPDRNQSKKDRYDNKKSPDRNQSKKDRYDNKKSPDRNQFNKDRYDNKKSPDRNQSKKDRYGNDKEQSRKEKNFPPHGNFPHNLGNFPPYQGNSNFSKGSEKNQRENYKASHTHTKPPNLRKDNQFDREPRYDERRDSIDSQQETKKNRENKGPNNWYKANSQDSGKKGDKQDETQVTNFREAKQHGRRFMDMPPLQVDEDRSSSSNVLEDIRSNSKFSSSKSESITSSDPHDVEMKILNSIHELKTALHLVEIKPSKHVQTEIKGLQKYIRQILDKWNPKAQSDSTSDSDSGDFDSSEEERKERNRKKNKKKKRKNKDNSNKNEDEKISVIYHCGTATTVKNNTEPQNNQLKNHNVVQFQENTSQYLNQPWPVNCGPPPRPPLLPMPVYPPLPQFMPVSYGTPPYQTQQRNDNFAQYSHGNLGPSSPQNTFSKPKVSKPSEPNVTKPSMQQQQQTSMDAKSTVKNLATPSSPKTNLSQATYPSPKTNLSQTVVSIVNDIRVSDVILSKTQINELREALEKFPMVDSSNVNNADLGEDFKNINICMIKVVNNETLSYDIKCALLGLLQDFFYSTCEETSHNELEKLIDIYKDALSENKNTKIDYVSKTEEAFKEVTHLTCDENKFNALCEFHESAREALTASNEHPVVVEQVHASENETESDETSSEDENTDESSDAKETKEEEKEAKAWKKKKEKVKLQAGLSVHCISLLSSLQNIEQQVNHLLEAYTKVQTPEFKNIEKRLLHQIKGLVKVMYPNCILHPFGSRVSNMALPDSDLDMYIDITGQSYSNSTCYEDQQVFVKKLKRVFYRNSASFSVILGLTRTKVPIIKVHHRVSGINCDISFKNGISVENTKLLCYYLSIDSRVKWLVTAVKLWAHYNHIYSSDFFTSHALTWLVLFYLMQVNIVPPVVMLQTNVAPRIIDHWNIAFHKLKDWVPSELDSSPACLFKDFFRFVLAEDFTNNFACTYSGKFIPKKLLSDLEQLKTHDGGIFKEYVSRLIVKDEMDLSPKENQSSMPLDSQPDQLVVQDPYEFSKNVSGPVKNVKFEHFNTLCCLTLEQLLSNYKNIVV